MNNTVGHSISGNYTDELLHLHFKIDRIFLKGKEQNAFWHELLRQQLYNHSLRDPFPILRDWQTTGHPFLDKYWKKDHIDLNELFWKHCNFNESHENFEIRIADAVNTIFSRHHNHRLAQSAFSFAKHCILADGRITGLVLNDVDVEKEIVKSRTLYL